VLAHLQLHIPQLKNSACVKADIEVKKMWCSTYETYESTPQRATLKLRPLFRRNETPTFLQPE